MMANTLVTTLLASANYAADATTTGASVAVGFPDGASDRSVAGIVFVLDLTVAAAASNDTCNVTVDAQVDGTNWMPCVAFTELLGDGGTTRQAIKIGNTTVAVAQFAYATGVQTVMANNFRGVVVIAGAGAGPSFTLSLVAVVM